MTTEEKIKHIAEVAIENTQSECDKSLNEYKARMDKYYNDKMDDARKRAQKKIQTAKEDFIKKNKKEYANEQIALKRKISGKQAELMNLLKEEVQRQLEEFTKTDEYMMLLEEQIKAAVTLAADNSVNIYIDANDADKKQILESRTNTRLLIYNTALLGGTIAEIPAKNILMDNSFGSRLESIMEEYTIKV